MSKENNFILTSLVGNRKGTDLFNIAVFIPIISASGGKKIIKAIAKTLIVKDIADSQFSDTERKGYKAVVRESNYGGIKQRWIIIESAARKKSDLRKNCLKMKP